MSSNAYVSEIFIANTYEATIPLAIADDYPLLVAGVQQFLASCADIVVVAECTRFQDLLAEVVLKRPKIILLGCETTFEQLSRQLRAIAEHHHQAKVIVFTGNDNMDFHEEAVRYGARGIILKHSAPELLARGVRIVHRGGLCFDPALTDRMAGIMVRRKPAHVPAQIAKHSSLTSRETQIVCVLYEGMRIKEAANELHISTATVTNHLTSIYRKLGLSNRTELLLYAHRNQLSASNAVRNSQS
jgi:DNA-binding NarL/FixJ family response regulator